MTPEFKCFLDYRFGTFRCPSCKRKTFYRFIDENTHDYVKKEFGICFNIKKCKFQNFPSYDHPFEDHYLDWSRLNGDSKILELKSKLFVESTKGNRNSKFALFLLKHLPKEDVISLLDKYKVGQFEFENASVDVFWRLDECYKIMNGKIISYNHKTNLRLKNLNTRWVANEDRDYNCIFGEHLLGLFSNDNVALVESEITAIICSYFWPEYEWLAVGGFDEINYNCYNTISILKNKWVTIFPYFTIPFANGKIGISEWNKMAKYITNLFPCKIHIGSLKNDKIKKLSFEKESLLDELLKF
jgi:hypothetical protein